MVSVLCAVLTACGGGKEPVLGTSAGAALAPTVTAVAPLANATGVAVNIKAITAAFSKPMDASTLTTSSFTLACGAANTAGVVGSPKTAVTGGGAVTYLSAGNEATLPLPLGSNLPLNADCTATITTAAKDTIALALASNHVWNFSTSLLADTTRPRVSLTVPATTSPGPTTGAITNAAITAIFTEDMAPASVTTAGAFTVTCTSPCVSPSPLGGAATYAVGSRTATYTPTAALDPSTTYTATIKGTGLAPVTDLALNALAGNQAALPAASDYIWTFTTAATPAAAVPLTVSSTVPTTDAIDICPNASVNATFNTSAIRLDELTVASNFSLTGPGATVVTPSSVQIDVLTGRIATFAPLADLPLGLYSAKLTGGSSGVKDLALTPNTMAADYIWSFTVVSCATPPIAPVSHLGTASTYGIMATAATTSTGATLINGDVSLEPGTSQGIPPLQVNGTIHVNDAASTLARADLLTGYNYYKGLPPGTGANALSAGADPGALFPTGIPPGTYTSGSTIIASTPLVFDAGGNSSAVWVFQIGSSLTTGASMTLINGAQAKNIYWVPTLDATVGIGTTFQGNILAGRDVTAVTGATINGRILAGATASGTVALQATTVNVPAP